MSIVFGYNPCSKEDQLHKTRLKPRRGAQGKFSTKTMKEIFERDGGRCVRCGTYQNLESKPHHVIFRSQGGPGTVDNGVTVCRPCHDEAHSKESVRRWFEQYRERYLLKESQ